MRPVVGITSYVEPASWAVWQDVPAALVPYAYVRMVTGAGARAVVLPPDDVDADVLRLLDGLVLAGGADVGPDLYGADPAPRTESRPDRDGGEMTLLRAALDADLPVLGVCRGMQLLAVAYGGHLHQHLPDVVGHSEHRPAPGRYGSHPVRFAPGSLVAEVMAGDREVNTYHHQGVADPGRLSPTAWAGDGVIEAIEDRDRRFVLGVQWHPEAAADVRPFAALVRATHR
ncbi:gamma-glutamyl-gamma-aminobutyrate hydrolase family protein [Micromonospora sp. NPDC049679]|uniref:gamma-glutamyl-gamma-aminobutyrate hydrolase family protein n=1 Tax=Micromonospora sp. NPDC049679 TaxID=3155920 RepID=UPI0033EC0B35